MPKRGLLTAIRNPAQLVVLAFTTLIMSGAFLLWLPISASGSSHISADNAIFMATSAATVTGLSSLDIANFTIFGQLVILLLIQVGGFGIMTIGSVLAIVASHRLGLRQRMLAQAEIGAVDIGDLKRLIGAIARITLVVELATGLILFLRFWLGGYDSAGRSAYTGFYTAIAAFNNSGLTPYSDNLARFVGDPVVVFTVSFGFIIGGLGFPIIVESFRRARHRRRHGAKSRVLPWALHTKITVIATLVLLVVGPVSVLAFEWTNPGTLGALDFGEKLLAGWFQGTTPRTAGFNTVDIGAMRESTLLIITVLMFIGAGSASTGGGIKVTTFAILGWVMWSEVQGRRDVNIFGRRIPSALIRQAITVALLSVGVVVGATLVLMTIDDFPLMSSLVEVTSGFGTVGLSTGITSAMSTLGKLLVVIVMLTGRVGPVTFVTALALRERPETYRYPEERPIIG